MVHNTQLLDVGFDSVCISVDWRTSYCLPIAAFSNPIGAVAPGGFRGERDSFHHHLTDVFASYES